MKRNILFLLFLVALAIISCRSDDSEPQKIDQIMDLYIDSLGQDLLDKSLVNSYTSFSANDIHGDADESPVTMTRKMTSDSVYYIRYVSGATRVLTDSIDANHKYYESLIAMVYNKYINDSTSYVVVDTMKINYSHTPEAFQIDNVYYNNTLVFTKTPNQANNVKVEK